LPSFSPFVKPGYGDEKYLNTSLIVSHPKLIFNSCQDKKKRRKGEVATAPLSPQRARVVILEERCDVESALEILRSMGSFGTTLSALHISDLKVKEHAAADAVFLLRRFEIASGILLQQA
jgi:hypothetical protein